MKAVQSIRVLMWVAIGCACCASTAHAGPPVVGEFALVQFAADAGLHGWKVLDGGAGCGFTVNEAGNAVFSGRAGDAAIQCDFEPVDAAPFLSIVLGLKGDGRSYQLSLQTARDVPQVYTAQFQTSGEWETIEIPFADMVPAFPSQALVWLQIRADDGPGSFRLEIDRIWLK